MLIKELMLKFAVIDDSSTMRRIIVNTLKGMGHTDIIQGEDGVEGWKVIDANPDVDIILTDWNMPNMNGLELVIKIRSDSRFEKTPIVMVTTEGGKKEVIIAMKAGVNNYIVKPFSAEILKEKLDGLVTA
jgi:two-component system chemotaxis response regulator CheY